MAEWDRYRALAAFEAFKLTGSNATMAIYWLSLWQGGRPPGRDSFNPARVRDLLPAIALGEVHENGDVVCRLSGRYIDMAFGRTMRGADVLSLVDGEERVRRRARLLAIVDGHVALSKTRYERSDGTAAIAETIQLPFFGTKEDGSRQYVTHTNYRPSSPDSLGRTRPQRDGRPDIYRAISLCR